MTDWVFQVHGERFDVHADVRAHLEDWWNTPWRRTEISIGDRVFLAVAGRHEPGVHYVATVTSACYEGIEDENGFGHWRTDVRFEYRIAPPLSRVEIRGNPVLGSCYALRGFQGSNLPLSPEQGDALWTAVRNRLIRLPE